MSVKFDSIPETLNRYLSAGSDDDVLGVANYLKRGAELVTRDAMRVLHGLRGPLQAKIGSLKSEHLRLRVELLDLYFDEASADGQMGTPAHREAAFALLYFLKGFDRIPDSIPEIGLLDDAMIVQIALDRHAAMLRAHWLRRGRAWPIES